MYRHQSSCFFFFSWLLVPRHFRPKVTHLQSPFAYADISFLVSDFVCMSLLVTHSASTQLDVCAVSINVSITLGACILGAGVNSPPEHLGNISDPVSCSLLGTI